jgi:hypothetical protein
MFYYYHNNHFYIQQLALVIKNSSMPVSVIGNNFDNIITYNWEHDYNNLSATSPISLLH